MIAEQTGLDTSSRSMSWGTDCPPSRVKRRASELSETVCKPCSSRALAWLVLFVVWLLVASVVDLENINSLGGAKSTSTRSAARTVPEAATTNQAWCDAGHQDDPICAAAASGMSEFARSADRRPTR